VGSSKSTIARLLKKGLERYSSTRRPVRSYTLGWVDDNDPNNNDAIHWCPMNEEPLHLFPERFRPDVEADLNAGRGEDDQRVTITGELDPFCRFMYYQRLKSTTAIGTRVVQDIRVKRLISARRIASASAPPAEGRKESGCDRAHRRHQLPQDRRVRQRQRSAGVQLRRRIQHLEPRHHRVRRSTEARRGLPLRLARREPGTPHQAEEIRSDDIDEVIIGHTNEPEYRRLQNNEFMEALRDRTVKIDVPYVTQLANEVKIYEKDYNKRTVRGKHIAPHTIEMAAMWALLTRLEEPKHAGLTRLQKLKLYNGKTLPGFTEENIKELREHAVQEGMIGISPRLRAGQNLECLVAHPDAKSINPFMVLNELEAGLKHHSLITNEEVKQEYRELLNVVKEEYENVVKNEVQRAIAADEDALKRLCGNYIDNVKAYTQKERVKNRSPARTKSRTSG